MGAERWLLFKTAEVADHARKFLSLIGPDIPIQDQGCFLNWTGPRKLEVGYSFGWLDDAVATFVCREISRRFKVSSIGVDSSGWYSNKDWANTHPKGPSARYGPYTKWADWMKDYKPEWSPEVRFEPESIEEVRQIEAAVVEIFTDLDKKNSGV